MATQRMRQNARNQSESSGERAVRIAQERPREFIHEMMESLTDYARENPASAALWCLGIGFVLGWKLKPW